VRVLLGGLFCSSFTSMLCLLFYLLLILKNAWLFWQSVATFPLQHYAY